MADTWVWYLRRTAGLAEVPTCAEGPYVRAEFVAQVEAQRVQDAELARIDAELDREIRRIDDDALRQRTRALGAAKRARDALVPLSRADLPRQTHRHAKRPRIRPTGVGTTDGGADGGATGGATSCATGGATGGATGKGATGRGSLMRKFLC